eukprot:scaffold98566_cov60-Phaeocystis_antarctica.AAC.1
MTALKLLLPIGWAAITLVPASLAMRARALLLLLCAPRATAITVGPDTRPHVNGNRILLDGGVHAWQGPSTDVSSPIQDAETGKRTAMWNTRPRRPASTAQAAGWPWLRAGLSAIWR